MNILQEDHLSNLPEDLIQKAKHMSKVYEYIYCIENLLRIYLDKHINKTKFNYPKNVLSGIEIRKNDELKHKWLSLRGNSDLFYMDFKDISGLLNFNWELVKDDFPSQSWITAKLEDLARYRNLIAHNSFIDKSDLDTVKVHFNTISRQLNVKHTINITEPTNPDALFVKGLNNTKTYSSLEIYEGIYHELNYPPELEVTPTALVTYFEQIGPFFSVNFENTRVHLGPEIFFDEETEAYDNFDENSPFIKFQVGQFDIDGDGMEELFICVQKHGDETSDEIKVNVFKYYPPAYKNHAYRDENWEKMGTFDCGAFMGEPIAYISENTIYISRNFRGYFSEWVYVKGEFIERGF